MTVFNRINWRASGEVGFGPTNGSSAGELAEHLPPNPDSRRPPRPGGRRRARGLAAGTVRGGLGYLRFVYSPPKRGEESSQRTRRWRKPDSNRRSPPGRDGSPAALIGIVSLGLRGQL